MGRSMAWRGPRTWTALKVIVSGGLILWLLSAVDLSVLVDLVATVNAGFLGLAGALIVVEQALLSYKWNQLLKAREMGLPFLEAFRVYYISSFIGSVLPSSVTGDVFRVYRLYRRGAPAMDATSSVLVERVLALASILLVTVGAATIWTGEVGRVVVAYVGVAGLGGAVVASAILGRDRLIPVASSLLGRIDGRIGGMVASFYAAIAAYARYRAVLLYVLALSVLFQAVRVMITYCVALAIEQDVSIVYFFAVVPLTLMVGMLPISVGGIGVREGAFVYFFTRAGMGASEALTLSLLVYAVAMLAVLPGGIAYMLEGALRGSEPGPEKPRG